MGVKIYRTNGNRTGRPTGAVTETLHRNDFNEIKIYRKKIKNVRLCIKRDATIHISVPPYFNDHDIDEIIEKNRNWINSKQQQMRDLTTHAYMLKDREIFYRGEVWQNEIIPGLSEHVLINTHIKTIKSAVPLKGAALVKWYKEQAKFYLPAKLREVSAAHGFNYSRAVVKALRSKWGSCRTDDVITLNAKLIVAPDDVCEAIMLHELAHTVRHDHSKAFWTLLYSVCPGWDSASAWLKKYHNFIERLWIG